MRITIAVLFAIGALLTLGCESTGSNNSSKKSNCDCGLEHEMVKGKAADLVGDGDEDAYYGDDDRKVHIRGSARQKGKGGSAIVNALKNVAKGRAKNAAGGLFKGVANKALAKTAASLSTGALSLAMPIAGALGGLLVEKAFDIISPAKEVHRVITLEGEEMHEYIVEYEIDQSKLNEVAALAIEEKLMELRKKAKEEATAEAREQVDDVINTFEKMKASGFGPADFKK